MFEAVSQQFSLFGGAFIQAFSYPQVFVTIIATVAGIVVGAVPGLTATMALALLINLTYSMQLSVAVAFLLGVYVGAVMGGCYSAIMINIPGTPSAAATALDGFVLARSEEHTSELQSRPHLVCRLLLEKKKKQSKPPL